MSSTYIPRSLESVVQRAAHPLSPPPINMIIRWSFFVCSCEGTQRSKVRWGTWHIWVIFSERSHR